MNDISYINAHTFDMDEVKKLLQGVFDEPSDSNVEHQLLSDWLSITEMLEIFPNAICIEARTSGSKLIGMVFTTKQNPITWPDGHKMEVQVLAVDQSYQRLGIGASLMRRAEEVAKNAGAKVLVLNTHSESLVSQAFYRKLNYREIGRLDTWYDNGTAVFFAKQL